MTCVPTTILPCRDRITIYETIKMHPTLHIGIIDAKPARMTAHRLCSRHRRSAIWLPMPWGGETWSGSVRVHERQCLNNTESGDIKTPRSRDNHSFYSNNTPRRCPGQHTQHTQTHSNTLKHTQYGRTKHKKRTLR